ncbi:MAG: head-tail connector protein [Clostridium sp.]
MELKDIKSYLRVDYDEDDSYISEIIEVSGIYIETCVGEYYKTDPKAIKLFKLLQKKIIQDMYDKRGTEIPNNTKKDIIVTTILDKLSLLGEVE